MASWVSLNDLYIKTEGESTVNGTLKIVNANTGTSNGLLVNQPGSTDSFYNVGDEIKSLRDSVSSVVLYSNDAGTTSSFTLSKSAANFEAMDIFFFHDIGSENVDYSTRLYKPNGRIATLHGISTGSTVAQYAWSSWKISGKTVTTYGECYINFNKGSGSPGWSNATSSEQHLHVRAVIGYRKLA